MSHEPKQPDDPPAASNQLLEGDDLRAFFEESRSRERLALEEKYGPDVRLLAQDDDKLSRYLESEDLSRKLVALLCLLHFHSVYPERNVREAARYIVGGDDIQIRSVCVRYLSQSRIEAIHSILKDCASELETRESRPGDDVMRRVIASQLKVIYEGPPSFSETARMALEILARLKSDVERDD